MQHADAIDGTTREQRFLWPLVGIVAAILLWVGAEDLREKVRVLELQRASSVSQPARSAADALARAERDAAAARRERAVIEKGLLGTESQALLQTRFLHELRQRCQAVGAQSCVVRFSSDANRGPASGAASAAATAARTAGLAGRPVGEVGIEDLGLAKARAIVSGTFQSGELLAFVEALQGDKERFWRINGLVVRSNNFELDVEQLIRPPVPSPAKGRADG